MSITERENEKIGIFVQNLKNFKCLKGSFPPRKGSNHTYKFDKKTFLEKLWKTDNNQTPTSEQTVQNDTYQQKYCMHLFSKIYTMLTGNITERMDADEEKYLEKVNLLA